MCGTATVEFSCGHEEVRADAGGLCAIAHTNKTNLHIPTLRNRLFCWSRYPQGIQKDEGLCKECLYRLKNYGTTDPAISMVHLTQAARHIEARID